MRAKLGFGGLVAVVGLTAAACGGGASSKVAVSSNLLASAYNSSLAAKSANVDVHMTVTPATGGPTASQVTGVVEWKPLRAALVETVYTAAGSVTLHSRLVGTDIYVELPAQYQAATGGKPWLEASLSALAGNNVSQFDPTQALALLAGQTSSITKVGAETVDGVATTHYRAVRDLSQPASTPIAAQLTGKLIAMTGSSQLPVDVWVDSAGRLVQTKLSLTLAHPPAGTSAAKAAAFPITEAITETLSDYGLPVTVDAPPQSQVSPVDLTQMLKGGGL